LDNSISEKKAGQREGGGEVLKREEPSNRKKKRKSQKNNNGGEGCEGREQNGVYDRCGVLKVGTWKTVLKGRKGGDVRERFGREVSWD